MNHVKLYCSLDNFTCISQEAFTRVLMGNIDISRTIFPSGTKGEFDETIDFRCSDAVLPCLTTRGRCFPCGQALAAGQIGILLPQLVCFTSRREHGDAGPPGTVGGGTKLRPWNWSWCWKLLWSS